MSFSRQFSIDFSRFIIYIRDKVDCVCLEKNLDQLQISSQGGLIMANPLFLHIKGLFYVTSSISKS